MQSLQIHCFVIMHCLLGKFHFSTGMQQLKEKLLEDFRSFPKRSIGSKCNSEPRLREDTGASQPSPSFTKEHKTFNAEKMSTHFASNKSASLPHLFSWIAPMLFCTALQGLTTGQDRPFVVMLYYMTLLVLYVKTLRQNSQ